jgi:glycosyltransferase 2 family protein
MRGLSRLLLLAGLLFLAALLWRLGPAAVARNVAAVGWGFAAIVALDAVTTGVKTLGWRCVLPSGRRCVRFRTLFGMRLAGDGVNALAPAAVVGGELVRVRMLRGKLPTPASASSVALAALAEFLSQIVFVLAAAPLILARVAGARIKGLLLIAAAALLLVTGFGLVAVSRGDGFRRIHGLLHRRGWLASESSVWASLDEEIFGFLRRHPLALLQSVLFFCVSWAMGAVEVYLILLFLGSPVAPATAVTIEALSVAIEGILFFVPSKLGVQEGDKYFIFASLGLDPVRGVALGLVRRLRELCSGSAGLLILAIHERRDRRAGLSGAEAGLAGTAGPSVKERPAVVPTGGS